MQRREFVLGGAACCAGLCGTPAWAQALQFTPPERLARPALSTDEGGLWAMMEREERKLRRSPLLVKDPKLTAYLQDLVCRIGGAHCPDIRVYPVRSAAFNASMAPNGMMQIWTGLLLRVDNEAQLAAVLGHEIGHYLQRHTQQRLQDLKSRSAFAQFIGVFGLAGAVGQIAVMGSAFAYARDQEREADQIGAILMSQAGYDVAESATVWRNLITEAKTRDAENPGANSPMFATHPLAPEREDALSKIAKQLPEGRKADAPLLAHTNTFLDEWLGDELRRNQYNESLVLLNRLVDRPGAGTLAQFYRAEAHRLRNEPSDADRALSDYREVVQHRDSPPAAHRGIGLIARDRGQNTQARQSLSRYLELAPDAPDAGFIQSYLAELPS